MTLEQTSPGNPAVVDTKTVREYMLDMLASQQKTVEEYAKRLNAMKAEDLDLKLDVFHAKYNLHPNYPF